MVKGTSRLRSPGGGPEGRLNAAGFDAAETPMESKGTERPKRGERAIEQVSVGPLDVGDDETSGEVGARHRTSFVRSGAGLVLVAGVLALTVMGASVLRSAAARQALASPAKGQADYCLSLAATELYSPAMLDHMVMSATSLSGLSNRLIIATKDYQVIAMDDRSAEVSGPLGAMTGLLTAWDVAVEASGVPMAQHLYQRDKGRYSTAYAAFSAFSKTVCPT